jgi:hypothetical protein
MRQRAAMGRAELPVDLVQGRFTVARARELGLRAHADWASEDGGPRLGGGRGCPRGARVLGGWLLEGDQAGGAESQGADHADRRRRSSDAHRSGLARDHGWTLLEMWAEGVWSPTNLRTTLRRFALALGLDPARRRLD